MVDTFLFACLILLMLYSRGDPPTSMRAFFRQKGSPCRRDNPFFGIKALIDLDGLPYGKSRKVSNLINDATSIRNFARGVLTAYAAQCAA